jgi:hypothetical protein
VQRDCLEGVKDMRMSPPKRLLEQFLSNLKTNLEQKGFDFDFKLIKRHLHLYRFDDHHKPYFLFIRESLCGFWEISPNWQEISHLIPSENRNWAVILLQKPSGENHPLGFLMPSSDFVKMTSGFRINRMGRIKIHQKDLSSKNRFNNWESFFRLLSL